MNTAQAPRNTMSGASFAYGMALDGDELLVTRTSEAEDERRVTRLRRVE